MKKVLRFLSLLCVSSICFAQNTTQTISPNNSTNKSPILTSRYPIVAIKSMLYLDKLSFDNEQQFKKNIPIAKMNSLIEKYMVALRVLNQSTQANDFTLEIIYRKDSQSFNLVPKNKTFDQEIYKQAIQALEKIEKPQVDTQLKVFIKGHTIPVKN